MDAQEKLMHAGMISCSVVLLTVAYIVTFLALWQYRVWVAASLFLLLLVILAVVGMVKTSHALNEQALRHKQVHYHQELPLDSDGMPWYLPKDAQPNPHQSSYSVPYQQQQPRGY